MLYDLRKTTHIASGTENIKTTEPRTGLGHDGGFQWLKTTSPELETISYEGTRN